MRERKTRDPEMTFNGLYYFRLLALGLVVYQHIASNLVARVSLSTDLICFNSGQTGVAFFCILSGYLSGLTFRKNKNWLTKRLFKIFPSYWIALLIWLLGNVLLGYKNMEESSILLQFLGLSHLVPSETRLNVATWFITLILFNYSIAASAMWLAEKIGALKTLGLYLAITLAVLYFKLDVGFLGKFSYSKRDWPCFFWEGKAGNLLVAGG